MFRREIVVGESRHATYDSRTCDMRRRLRTTLEADIVQTENESRLRRSRGPFALPPLRPFALLTFDLPARAKRAKEARQPPNFWGQMVAGTAPSAPLSPYRKSTISSHVPVTRPVTRPVTCPRDMSRDTSR